VFPASHALSSQQLMHKLPAKHNDDSAHDFQPSAAAPTSLSGESNKANSLYDAPEKAARVFDAPQLPRPARRPRSATPATRRIGGVRAAAVSHAGPAAAGVDPWDR
jgi:hypothetical protein